MMTRETTVMEAFLNKCPNCRKPLEPQQKFCTACGTRVRQEIDFTTSPLLTGVLKPRGAYDDAYCPFCEAELSSDSRACYNCGEVLAPLCPTCNQEVKWTWRKCPHCTADLPTEEFAEQGQKISDVLNQRKAKRIDELLCDAKEKMRALNLKDARILANQILVLDDNNSQAHELINGIDKKEMEQQLAINAFQRELRDERRAAQMANISHRRALQEQSITNLKEDAAHVGRWILISLTILVISVLIGLVVYFGLIFGTKHLRGDEKGSEAQEVAMIVLQPGTFTPNITGKFVYAKIVTCI